MKKKLDFGKMIKQMVIIQFLILMVLGIEDLQKTVNLKDMEFINGIMEIYMKENGKIHNLMDMEYINILMVQFIKECGKIIILKVMEN